jgi:hypothetical protein
MHIIQLLAGILIAFQQPHPGAALFTGFWQGAPDGITFPDCTVAAGICA